MFKFHLLLTFFLHFPRFQRLPSGCYRKIDQKMPNDHFVGFADGFRLKRSKKNSPNCNETLNVQSRVMDASNKTLNARIHCQHCAISSSSSNANRRSSHSPLWFYCLSFINLRASCRYIRKQIWNVLSLHKSKTHRKNHVNFADSSSRFLRRTKVRFHRTKRRPWLVFLK